MLLIESSWTTCWPGPNSWPFEWKQIVPKYFLGSWNCCFGDVLVTHCLGFLETTAQHKQQKLNRLSGERERETKGHLSSQVHGNNQNLSTSKSGLSLLTAQAAVPCVIWVQWIISPIIDAALHLSRAVYLPLWLIMVQQEQGPETITIK